MGRIGNNITRYLNAFNAKDIKFFDINVETDDLNIAKNHLLITFSKLVTLLLYVSHLIMKQTN